MHDSNNVDWPVPANLHIGGSVRREGWVNLDIQPGPHVDRVGNCVSLAQFADASFETVYASHVLEHLGYHRDLGAALAEIHRVLKPGGKAMISVPDLEILCRMFVHPELDEKSRFHIMRVMFGGQMDEHDFHRVGLSWPIFGDYLRRAGFQSLRRVEAFGIFDDASSLKLFGHRISLNVEARKPA